MDASGAVQKTIEVLEKRVEELERLYQEARELQLSTERWAALGRVAGTLAHRVSSKAGLIRLCVKDLYDSIAPDDEWARRNLDTIDRQNQYLLDVVEQLFRPVSASVQELKVSDINLLLKEAISRASIPAQVELVVNCADDLPAVLANEWLVEAFVELISNAVQALAGSSRQVLEVGSRQSGDGQVEVWFDDTGCGIPPQNRERIFEPFYTSYGNSKGNGEATGVHLGFGLWWVRTLLRELGGEIDFESEVNRGTTFTVHLPCSKDR